MAFKDAVTEMALFTLLWETTLRPSLQMWTLRLSRVAKGILNMAVGEWGEKTVGPGRQGVILLSP